MKSYRTDEQTHQNVSTDTFDLLYKQYVKKVFQKCLSMTKDSDTAQDYTQEIFLKAFTKLNSFQSRSTFSTWLFSITHNYCLDQLRINSRYVLEDLSDDLVSQLKETEYQQSADYKLQQLENLLAQLSAEEVMLLRLKHEQNMSVKELSKHYQLTESAVKMRLKRSRDKLIAIYTAQQTAS
ncbi:sigma-70 family RNA polymerase sigma factor [Spirosoma sp. SC4-14]|uniref:RNA polymerase sigma factor n=1 Tax=Spirosoma sp. SC4-14 TaxID=3128900 RepID=UPI0030CB7F9D